MMLTGKRWLAPCAAFLAASVVLAGCGSSSGSNASSNSGSGGSGSGGSSVSAGVTAAQ